MSPHNVSKEIYFSIFENGIAVLPDNGTIIGVKDQDKPNTLVIENLTETFESRSCELAQHSSWIYSVCFLEKLGHLLVGDEAGHLTQYSLDLDIKQVSLLKQYSALHIDWIVSISIFGHLAVLGGFNSGKSRVVDLKARQVLDPIIKTDVGVICSIQFCQVSSSIFILAITGKIAGSKKKNTVLLDVCPLLKKYNLLPTEKKIKTKSREKLGVLDKSADHNNPRKIKKSKSPTNRKKQKQLSRSTQKNKRKSKYARSREYLEKNKFGNTRKSKNIDPMQEN